MLLICLDILFSIFCTCSMCLCQDSKERGQDLEWKSGQGGGDTQIIVIQVVLPFYLKQS